MMGERDAANWGDEASAMDGSWEERERTGLAAVSKETEGEAGAETEEKKRCWGNALGGIGLLLREGRVGHVDGSEGFVSIWGERAYERVLTFIREDEHWDEEEDGPKIPVRSRTDSSLLPQSVAHRRTGKTS